MSYDKSYMNKYPLIHVLPQWQWHSHAAIVGNRLGLEMLRNAIANVLDDPMIDSKASALVYCNDGEGYHLAVCQRHDMSDVPLGYTDECAKDDTPYPEWLINAIKE